MRIFLRRLAENHLGPFMRFGIIGTLGFLIDTGALYAIMEGTGLGPYTARIFSYLIAATITWFFHRNFTFSESDKKNPHRQWATFLATNAVGGGVNYGVFAALVAFTDPVAAHPVLGVAAGSVAGLIFNFTISRWLVFRPNGDDTAIRHGLE